MEIRLSRVVCDGRKVREVAQTEIPSRKFVHFPSSFLFAFAANSTIFLLVKAKDLEIFAFQVGFCSVIDRNGGKGNASGVPFLICHRFPQLKKAKSV